MSQKDFGAGRILKVGDYVSTDVVPETHKRIREIRGMIVTLEWYDGTEPIPVCEYVHVSHLTFISKKPTENFNYFYLLHKK